MKFNIIILILLFSTASFAQQNTRLTILSEVHLTNINPTYKIQLIEQLHDSTHMNDVILEVGKSAAYLYNEFVKTGDEKLLTNIYTYYNSPANNYFLKELHKFHQQGKQIILHGMDFERIEFARAIEHLLEKTNRTDNRLFDYLHSLPDTVFKMSINTDEARLIFKKCKAIYQEDTKYYDTIIDNGFSIRAVFDNRASVNQFSKRNKAMFENIEPLVVSNKPLLLIVGNSHIDHKGKLYEYIRKVIPQKNINVISILAKECELKAMYFDKKKLAYSGNDIFTSDTTIASALFKECNGSNHYTIIKTDNNFYKKFPLKRVANIDHLLLIDCSNN